MEPDVQDNENQRCDLKIQGIFCKGLKSFLSTKNMMAAETLERARIHVPDATPRLFPKVVVHFGRNSPGFSAVFIGFRGGEEWRLLGHPKKHRETNSPPRILFRRCLDHLNTYGIIWDYDAWSILIHPIIDAWNSKHGPKVLFF